MTESTNEAVQGALRALLRRSVRHKNVTFDVQTARYLEERRLKAHIGSTVDTASVIVRVAIEIAHWNPGLVNQIKIRE